MNEELINTPDFRIACCDLCTDLMIFEIAKRIYKENLANDKYGINNFL